MRNAGTISGGTKSVNFFGTGTNTLILQTGSVLIGDAVGSTAAGATNKLILQGSGTVDNHFMDFNTLDVEASGAWVWNSNSAIDATTVNSGTRRSTTCSRSGHRELRRHAGWSWHHQRRYFGGERRYGRARRGGSVQHLERSRQCQFAARLDLPGQHQCHRVRTTARRYQQRDIDRRHGECAGQHQFRALVIRPRTRY